MSHAPTYRREIDACRPGSDDLRLPELAELAQAVESDARVAGELAKAHARDIAVCEALQEVPLPSGLADRLLAQMQASPRNDLVTTQRTTNDDEAVQPAANVMAASLATPSERGSRRWWIGSLVAVAAAVLLMVGYASWNRPEPRTFSKNDLAGLAESWYQQALPAAGWTGSVSQQTLEKYPLDSALRFPATNERIMLIQGPAAGVAYDLTRSGKQRAVLFVVRTPDRFDVAPIAYTPIRVTGGVAMAAWQKGELLYVLVVDERDRQRLEDFVRKQPLT